MTELLEKASHDIEREKLQNRLAVIDRDPARLQKIIEELYIGGTDNPQVLYAAATYLTSLTYLDRRDETDKQQVLPEQHDAARAFATYTRLMAMLGDERDSPLYADDERIRRRLIGAREELAFHATLAYATAQGADFVALPSPAKVDFGGATSASDVQLFFPDSDTPDQEIQVKFDLKENGGTYEPHIAVMNLASALGGSKPAGMLRGLLKDVGDRADEPTGELKLNRREHGIVLEASAAILSTSTETIAI